MTSFEDFRELSRGGNVIPVYEVFPADTETPVSVYLKIQGESPYSFLLESVEGGERIGRYSFIGFNPFMSFSIHGKEFGVKAYHDDVQVLPTLVSPDDHPLEALRKIFRHIKSVRSPGLPRLSGGAIGYFGYECVQLVEEVPSVSSDTFDLPDALLLFYDVVLVFDNLKHRLFIVSNAYIADGRRSDSQLREEYLKAAAEIDRLKLILGRSINTEMHPATIEGARVQTMPREQFLASVDRCRAYIRDGDIFQVVLSQRLEEQATLNAFDLYRSLRMVNPSPYMYFLQCKDFAIIGASPEMLLRVEEGRVETRPIAGTRRRGETKDEDARLEQELLNDVKERAEHLMLVDLGRNDVGRISEFGSVTVEQFMSIEKYSHVMHLVSSVQGTLQKNLTALDALFSCFPAGTLSGAPKIRAMEIIAELEPVKRGVYGGAVAYIDFAGNLDSCIAIRTIVQKGRTIRFQAGAGIVYDSIPEREYEETFEKLRGNLRALELLVARDRSKLPTRS